MGCGWGSLRHYLRERGVTAVGGTLSRGQWAACRKNGLDAHLLDLRTITRDTFGSFDAVASIGAWEAFCSPEEFGAGKQGGIYCGGVGAGGGGHPQGGGFFCEADGFR